MSDEDILMETIRAANADEEFVDDQSVEEPAAEEEEQYYEEEEEPRVWAGKFNDPDALENAYLELQRKFHESRQPADDEVEYDQVEPQQYFGADPQTEEELVSFAEQNPTNAAMWVMQNADRLPEDLANAVLEHWWTQRPWEATQYWMEQRLSAERNELADMTMPLVEQHERAIMAEAYNVLLEQVPDYEEYQSRVEDFIDKFDVSGILPPGSENDPVALADGIGTIVGILKWREYQEAMRNQGMMIPDQDNVPAPRVSTTNTTVADVGSEEEMDDLIRNMILNA